MFMADLLFTVFPTPCEPLNLRFTASGVGPNPNWNFRALVQGIGCNPGSNVYSNVRSINMIRASQFSAKRSMCVFGDYLEDVKMPDAIPYAQNLSFKL